MDVSATVATGTESAVIGSVPATPDTAQAVGTNVSAQPPAATPAPEGGGTGRPGIAPAIAKLFGGASAPQASSLNVSYKVLHNPNQVVTVFTDPRTGQVVAQFPPELLVGLAEFFDYQSGVTLDRDA